MMCLGRIQVHDKICISASRSCCYRPFGLGTRRLHRRELMTCRLLDIEATSTQMLVGRLRWQSLGHAGFVDMPGIL